MEIDFCEQFVRDWTRYFPGADLPIVFSYVDDPGGGQPAEAATGHRCFICDLGRVRKGVNMIFGQSTLGCSGAKRYLGFSNEAVESLDDFLACGIPGELEGLRLKKTPDIAREQRAAVPRFEAPAEYLAARRIDGLEPGDEPQVAVFFAEPDVLAALYTLAGYDDARPDAVVAPFGAGCATIVQYPFQQAGTDQPRAVLGMFDISARPCVGANVLTLSVPWKKFVRMAGYMDESFLTTASWETVRARLPRASERAGDADY